MFVSTYTYVYQRHTGLIYGVTLLCSFIGEVIFWFADIVQKLIDKDKHIPAVKYILEFNLADKIPPVPVLEAAVDEAKKLGRKLSEEGNSSVSVSL